MVWKICISVLQKPAVSILVDTKIEAADSSDTSVNFYHITQCHIPVGSTLCCTYNYSICIVQNTGIQGKFKFYVIAVHF